MVPGRTLRLASRSSSSFKRADTSTGLALPKGLDLGAAGVVGCSCTGSGKHCWTCTCHCRFHASQPTRPPYEDTRPRGSSGTGRELELESPQSVTVRLARSPDGSCATAEAESIAGVAASTGAPLRHCPPPPGSSKRP